ncbi:MAG: hypothetical protein B7Z66_15510 [Chromatiales bacterium 21-64-14]|nr:MAG: hypothetical protein B7Z66_15510 [Chromatiales bacterium 21-64-14]
MGNRNRTLMETLGEPQATKKDTETGERERPGHLQRRDDHLSELVSGRYQDKVLLLVDPQRCRPWAHHNRRYDLLDEQRCADLIESFKAQGKQEFPAIVRRLEGDPDRDYEVICGARRLWTVRWLRANHYPDFRFLIEVRELTDEEAFRLADVENRDRVDISDYERALDYRHALERYYRTQEEMAKRLEVSPGWLSRYLSLGELPKEIIEAYPQVTEVRVQHARVLKPLLRSAEMRKRVLARAQELVHEQGQQGKEGGARDGQAVVRELVRAARPPQRRRAASATEIPSAAGKPMLRVAAKGRGGLVLEILPGNGAALAELREACARVLGEHFHKPQGGKIVDRQ